MQGPASGTLGSGEGATTTSAGTLGRAPDEAAGPSSSGSMPASSEAASEAEDMRRRRLQRFSGSQ